ncbi:hypothetical protein [Campylobacter phage CJLB-7]|nr:hypothetical protein [Campylobacter phage CJLB-7]
MLEKNLVFIKHYFQKMMIHTSLWKTHQKLYAEYLMSMM